MSAALAQLADVTRGFNAVELEELVTDAALLTRVDRKYVVPASDAAHIVGMVDPDTRVLDIDGERSFGYASVYFDTPDRVSYHLAAQPRRRRFKLRTRAYLSSGTAYLEMKTRGGRGATVKDRIPYDIADIERLTATGREYVGAALDAIGLDSELVHAMTPTLTTRYQRMTLLAPGGSRATVDTALDWIDADGECVSLPDHVIIESKSAGPATEFDRALWRKGHRPQGISKFGTGTAALHPELPSNKWARLLRGPFADTRSLTIPPAAHHLTPDTQENHS
ncbi:polyphosphate polymerase domain-containing protein [Leucobacter sp. NPDC058333]|uniref:polyphosphate polymerase domain-containing protein n=1 Tax=Leucobacter sp. NPDC058333 TaxID=3346450 RepID=UPI00364843A7